jgi:hypothetical protein
VAIADWIFALIVSACAFALAVHWRVWRTRGALRAWLTLVGGSVLGGFALYVAANFTFGWLFATSAVAAETIALPIIFALMIQTVRRLRRRL